MTSAVAADRTALARFGRGLAWLGRVELGLAVAAFAFVATLTMVQVTLRYGFGGALWWAQEVSQLAMLAAYFFGIAYVYKANQDVLIQFVVQRLPAALQFGLYLAIQVLIAAFCLLVAAQGLLLAPSQLNFRTYILNIPKFYSTLPLILASLSMAATAIHYALAARARLARAPRPAGVDALEAELTLLRETEGQA